MVDNSYIQIKNELDEKYQRIQRILFGEPSKYRIKELRPITGDYLAKAKSLYGINKNEKQIDEIVEDWEELLDAVEISLGGSIHDILKEAADAIPKE